jgi:isocitrate dehydrogenase (NAD+)
VIPGDGIGPDVVSAAQSVLEATGVPFEWDVHDVGPAALSAAGSALPDTALRAIRQAGVALKGPVSTVAGSSGTRSTNVALRRELGLSIQVRPCRSRPGVHSPFHDLDLVVIRDTTEDLYAGVEFAANGPDTKLVIDAIRSTGRELAHGSAIGIKPVSEEACRRLVEFSLAYARRHGHERLTVVHKATAMRSTDGLFLEVARDVLSGETDVSCDDRQIDAVCAELVRRPEAFGVLVTLNLYGDILSDLAAALTGGVGLAPGANYGGPLAVFEAAHGTAPRHAQAHRANPMAMILCGALLLRHVGAVDEADRVEAAVDAVLGLGLTVPGDVRDPESAHPAASTASVADAVVAAVATRSTDTQ